MGDIIFIILGFSFIIYCGYYMYSVKSKQKKKILKDAEELRILKETFLKNRK